MDYLRLIFIYSLNKRNVVTGFSILETVSTLFHANPLEAIGALYRDPMVRLGINLFTEVGAYNGVTLVGNAHQLKGYNKATDYYPPIFVYPKEFYNYASQDPTNALTLSLLYATGGVVASNVKSSPLLAFLYGCTLQEMTKLILLESQNMPPLDFSNTTVYTNVYTNVTASSLANSIVIYIYRYGALLLLVAFIYTAKKLTRKILQLPPINRNFLCNYFQKIKNRFKNRFKSLFRSKKRCPS